MTGRVRLSERSHDAGYARADLAAGVVHLGLGAFHRAHQAPLFDSLAKQGDLRWGIVGVAMRSREVVEAMAPQDHLYSVSIRGDAGESAPRVIGSICRTLVAAHQREETIAALAAPEVALVTLTITEKGYLDTSAGSAAELIAAALVRRHNSGLAPLTVLSCDNLTGNGSVARRAVLEAAHALKADGAALRWIEQSCAFPSTMVDRITPAMTPEMVEQSCKALGLTDEAAVWTEPFWQWVIEDSFAGPRPPLERLGVTFASSVEPWELAKLRMLNGAHSLLAYSGLLRGHSYVHQAIANSEIQQMVEALWDEVSEVLTPSPVDFAAYRAALVERFSNPALPHALIQIAADGSQKVPQRHVSTLRDRLARGLASPAVATAIASWIEALQTVEGLVDPQLESLRKFAGDDLPARRKVCAILSAIAVDMPSAEMVTSVAAALEANATA